MDTTGNIRTVYRSPVVMQGFVDMGLAVECLPENPNYNIYSCEDLIYGGFLYDPLEYNDILRAYPQLLKTLYALKGGLTDAAIL